MPMPKGKLLKAPDGTMVFVQAPTEKKKKNRTRHIKDGAPKSMRGKPKPFAEEESVIWEVVDYVGD